MTGQHIHRHAPQKVLIWTIALIAGFAVIEAITGYYAGSLALLSDAGHMFTDTFSLMIAAVAAWVSRKPATRTHTFGLGRAEVIGGWISSIIIIVLAIAIIIESVQRFRQPQEVDGLTVVVVASMGLLVNLFAGWLVSRGERTINIRAALLHILGDILGSVAALVSGTLIYYNKWLLADPLLSVLISVLIMGSAIQLLRESFLVLMEAVPPHIDLVQLGEAMTEVEQVRGIHDLHVWTLASGQFILSAHVEIDSFEKWDRVLQRLQQLLADHFHIEHITLQPEIHSEEVPVPEVTNKSSRYQQGGANYGQ